MGGSISLIKAYSFRSLLGRLWREEDCSVTQDDRSKGGADEGPRRSLQVILRSPLLVKRLVAYISDGWEPNVSNSPHSKAHMKMVGLNCVEFISDVNDFKMIPPSSFHSYRAYYIYEKFILHGALRAIPIGPNVADGCADKLFSGASDLSKAFRSAEGEASEFIAAEMGEAFFASQKDTFRERRRSSVSAQMTGDILSAVGKVRGAYGGASETEQTQLLRKLLSDSEQTGALRAYLRRVGEERHLSAYLEAAEIKEILSSAERSRNGNEECDAVMKSIFLHHINNFYSSFLCQGAPQRIDLSPSCLGDFMVRLVHCNESNADILSPLQECLFVHLVKYLEGFTGSVEYRQLLRVGRKSVLLLATDLTKERRADAGDRGGSREIPKMVFDELQTVTAMKELKAIIAGDSGAEKTLDLSKISALLNFVGAVAQFHSSSYVNETDKNAFFTNLFNKHVRQNAPECIGLPEPLRQAVLANIYGSSEDVFDEAQRWARQRLAMEYWTVVVKEQQRREQQQAKPGHPVNSEFPQARRKSVAKDVLLHASTMMRATRRRLSVYITAPKLHPTKDEGADRPAGAAEGAAAGEEREGGTLFSSAMRISIGRQDVQCHKGLAYIIEDAECCSLFKEYLDKEGGSQTLLFLFEVEEYRRLTSPAFQAMKAQALHSKYLHSLAILPVPVSIASRNGISVCIKEMRLSSSTFRGATCEVLQYMELVQLPRFSLSTQAERMKELQIAQAAACEGSIERGGKTPATAIMRRRSSILVAAKGPAIDLLKVLRYQSLTRFFKEFCGQSLNMENLFFYLDAEHYANIPGHGYLKNIAQRMARKYIVDGARFEINISSDVKADILKNIVGPSRSLFRRAQDEVFRLMERDVYSRFTVSPLYQEMIDFNGDNPALTDGTSPPPVPAASWRGIVRSSLTRMRSMQAVKG